MPKLETLLISLTGTDSHKLLLEPGQGSLSIGTRGESHGKYDLWVEPQQKLNWHAFDTLTTASNYPWPRFFKYSGNDLGFITWSTNRPIESFEWYPTTHLAANFNSAAISKLYIEVNTTHLNLTLDAGISRLHLAGNLAQIHLNQCSTFESLSFSPKYSDTECYQLPEYPSLANTDDLCIYVQPLGKSFDCRSLLQFPRLTSLKLWGSMLHLDCLASLTHLQTLGLRYMPELDTLPALRTWPNLSHFIGWNIEATAGKALQKQLKLAQKAELKKYSSVSQLRSKSWFIAEYALPFGAWENKNAKLATKAYKACLKAIQQASTTQEVQDSIAVFIAVINQLPAMETSEREDVAEAVDQLVAAAKFQIDPKEAQTWFDAVRDF
ncbi:hypothetical protein [uncultured Thiothrix sp.]|uniref:hypothetical protein n=1 Tax=uncultured Thiothrix sp. TaxID=223185 RepID=UPI00260D3CB3|nr:hypothetical protein [uncultured Thiothrix sp.]